MEESVAATTFEARIESISFSLATRQEICKASINDCPISHASQLSNPFLGLPLNVGKCESCGTGEPGQCEGHFGFIELPTAIYHPDHVGELKRMFASMCLKCLKLKTRKGKNAGFAERVLSCCEETLHVSVKDVKNSDGASYLELSVPTKSRHRDGLWSFLDKYGFRYGNTHSRPLLPSEVMAILKKISPDTRKKLCAKGYFPQDGYILQHLPVPPNCLSVPDVSDGISTMASDYSMTLLKKVLRQAELIKNSRSGKPNFESQEIEANDLQVAVAQYLEYRGTGKASRDVDSRFGVHKEVNSSSTKAWLEKMKTLFIRKGSGFSSRSVITGDAFKGVSEIGLPFEIAQKMTIEERVSDHNKQYLQKLVDEKLCLTYRDGLSTYSLKEGSKGHTLLRTGQVVHRRIMDGDIVFINRPPTTHKHSLQALSVYVHDDHTVKINPLICGPLSADFDGDCIHLFYPQSLEAKAEVVELFAVEKQLLSSHTGNFLLQLTNDSLLSLKSIFKRCFLKKVKAQQLAMCVQGVLSEPAVIKSESGPLWTASQILQTTFPDSFDRLADDRLSISKGKILRLDFDWDAMTGIVNDLVTSLCVVMGPNEVLKFFNSVQPLLMENLFAEGSSVSLQDFYLPGNVLGQIHADIQEVTPLLHHLRSSYSESVALQLDSYLRSLRGPVTNFIVKSSGIGRFIDSRSESALSRVVQQVGFLGIQISEKGKFYTEALVKEMSSLFRKKYPSSYDHSSEEFGLVSRPLFRGLDPYQEMVHSISAREVIVRSSRGLTEPGTLFKNLMAILRDVVICHDNTVRNMCSNSIIQFEYGFGGAQSEFCAGDPVGVLAATAMSNPAYKAVLDSSPSSNSSWDMMKEILLCGVAFKNNINDRRVILYLKNCDCGRKYCQEKTALTVTNHLKKVSLKDTAIDFLIEYRPNQQMQDNNAVDAGLIGHIHLNKAQLRQSNISMDGILKKCEDTIHLNQKKKKVGNLFRNIDLSISDCCSFCQSSKSKWRDVPCIQFILPETRDDRLDKASDILVDKILPVLLQTIIKGDPRVATANVVWISPDTTTWIRNPSKDPKGELSIDVILEKEAVKQNGDAWRVVMDTCLPIIHLIDTKRSMPYAIKQVQELLGISCAFEQAVQRLATSVTMVTKGVLKEHLLLLGNSMTSSGTLIGFNAGGVKSLSKSLAIQVPFMDATLFTPRKCFERAAEKCHVDNLSSIVASCAWGKHVSVGTGSPFEILWDTRQAELSPDKEIDVYNFLHLVSGNLKVDDNSCLGADVEDLDQEDGFMECELSPERESGQAKPTFEDGVEFSFNTEANAWGKKNEPEQNGWGSANAKPSNDSAWGAPTQNLSNDDSTPWGSSSQKPSSTNDSQAWGSASKKQSIDESSAWGASTQKPSKDDSTPWGASSQKPSNNDSPAWGAASQKKCTESQAWGASKSQANDDTPTWGASKSRTNDDAPTWCASKSRANDDVPAWGASKSQANEDAPAWGASKSRANEDAPAWGASKSQANDDVPAWGASKSRANDDVPAWGASKSQAKDDAPTWGASKSQANNDAPTWGTSESQVNDDASSWGFAASKKQLSVAVVDDSSAWGPGSQSQSKDDPPAWGSASQKKLTNESPAWGASKSQVNDDPPTWGSGSQSQSKDDSAAWGSASKESNDASTAWGSASQTKSKDDSPAWGSASKKETNDATTGWGSKQSTDSPAWGSSSKVDESDEKSAWTERGRGWSRGGRGRGRDSGRGRGDGGRAWGRSNGGDWRNDRIGTPRSTDGFNSLGNVTMTRIRLDLFTEEEQDILTETESIMKDIRRIMSLPGYIDGERLPEEDQKIIRERIFNYHPDKAKKEGAGLDYIMVDKHKDFQTTRCFFAVTTEGVKEDFSYRKCFEHLLREKYPEKVDAFIAKYWQKPQPRPAWNNNRGGRGGEPGTPSSWNRGGDQTPGRDESVGTPRWGREPTTPKWGQDQSTGPSTPSGWGQQEQSTGPPTPGGWGQQEQSAGPTTSGGWGQQEKSTGPTTSSGWDQQEKSVGPATSVGWGQEEESMRPTTTGVNNEEEAPVGSPVDKITTPVGNNEEETTSAADESRDNTTATEDEEKTTC